MSYRTLKSKLFRTIGGLTVAGMVLAGVATITAFTTSSPQAANPGDITPPPLPAGMAPVPAGNKLFLGTHGVGTQNYVCRPSGAGVAYVLFTPQATLFSEDGGQVITHYFSPNLSTNPPDHILIQRWWPMARSASRGSTGTRALSRPSCTNLARTAAERSPSTRGPLPGSCSMRLESRRDRPVATR